MFGSGQTNLMDLLGFAIVASIFPNFFGGGYGNNGPFGSMNSDLVMQAVTAQGEASRTAIQTLASSIGQDFNIVYGAVSNVQNMLSSLALQQAVSVPQIINAIQAGDSNLAAQLSQCCCENRLLTTQQGYEAQIRTLEQTNQLGNSITGQGQKTVDAIADLKTTMIKEFCDARERDMQGIIDKQADEISQLRTKDNISAQTNQILGYVNTVLAPIQAAVKEIQDKMPNTVPVQYPNLVAINNTPYAGNYYGGNYGFGTF